MLVKEEADWKEAGAGIALGQFEEVGAWRVKDQGGDGGVICRELGGKGGPYAGAVRDDLLRRESAGGGEVLPGGVDVVGHVLLVGAGCCTLAVAAVVEGEDVEAEVVQAGEGGEVVGQGTVGAGQEEDGGVRVAGVGRRGDPPAGELWGGGFVGAEVDELVGDACYGGRCCGGAGGVEDELPLPLVEEEAEGEIAADECSDDGCGYGLSEPKRAYDFRRGVGWRGALAGLRSGAGHESASVSTLAFEVEADESFWEWAASKMEIAEDFEWRSG